MLDSIYTFMAAVFTPWVLAVLMTGAAAACLYRYRRRGGDDLWPIISSFSSYALYFWWALVVEPPLLYRQVVSRAIIVSLCASVMIWGFRSKKRDEQ